MKRLYFCYDNSEQKHWRQRNQGSRCHLGIERGARREFAELISSYLRLTIVTLNE